MYEAILNMNRREPEELIEAIVTREVKKQLSAIKQKHVKKEKLADVKEAMPASLFINRNVNGGESQAV